MDFTEMFCVVDDFCLVFEPDWQGRLLEGGERLRNRSGRLSTSEIMTIVIGFHQSNYRTFKYYYFALQAHHRGDFPDLVSYTRFVTLMSSVAVPLLALLLTRQGAATGIAFVDSTPLRVCHIKRANRHRTFLEIAAMGRSTIGWFFGFKLHLVVNDQGELLAFQLTPANTDDRVPVPDMMKKVWGKVFGDKGYISQALFEELLEGGVELITSIRKNMRNKLMPLIDKVMLRKRSLIETINDQLKNISQIEHSRHRSPKNFVINLISGLIAYTFQPKKPQLQFNDQEMKLLEEAQRLLEAPA